MRITIHIVIEVEDVSPVQQEQMPLTARCVVCGWKRSYASPASARRGLAGHYAHCPGPGTESKSMFDQLTSSTLRL